MSQTDEIKSKLDIVGYIQQYASLKRAGRTYKACCPFHSEKTPSFVVNPDKQTWRCFGACNEGGDIFTFAQKYHHWSFSEALEELGRLAGVEVRPQSPLDRQKEERRERLRGLMKAASDYYHAQLLNGSSASVDVLRYAKEKRGFSDETITRYQIGYAPQGWQHLHDEFIKLGYSEEDLLEVGLLSKNEAGRVYDRFRHRLMIPIRDEKGRVIAFGARALNPDDNPKYLNSPKTILFDKSHTLFGLDVAKQTILGSEIAVIVEGYMDAIQAHQAGFLNVVAQMGTALTEHQVKLLAPRYAKKIILALDSDVAGQSATRKSIETVREVLQADYISTLLVDIHVLQIPGAKDPDDLIRENPQMWDELVSNSMPAVKFVISTETAEFPQGLDVLQVPLWKREETARRIVPIIATVKDLNIRDDNMKLLSQRLSINYSLLNSWAEKFRVDNQRSYERKVKGQSTASPKSQQILSDEQKSSDLYMTFASDDIDKMVPIPPDEEETTNLVWLDEPPLADLSLLVHPPEEDFLSAIEPSGDVKVEGEWDWTPIELPKPEPVKPPKLTAERALEAYFLKILLKSSNIYYQINRKLRSLANYDEILLEDTLSELLPRDFFANDYQIVMRLFIEAMGQQDQDVIDYIKANSPQSIHPVLTQLLNMDAATEVKRQLNHKFIADVQASAQNIMLELTDEQIMRESMIVALRLRRSRLLQELQEYKIMLSDLDSKEDEQLLQEIRIRVKYVAKAMGAIDKGIQEVQKM